MEIVSQIIGTFPVSLAEKVLSLERHPHHHPYDPGDILCQRLVFCFSR